MIYLDNAATTSLHPDVANAMHVYLTDAHGNPSSIHALGRQARRAIDDARTQVAELLGCPPSDLFFTSGGTESIYTAILGALLAAPLERRHVVSTAVEHHAVLHTLSFAEHIGADVTLVRPNRDGAVSVEDILDAIRPETSLVTVMRVNNELGTVLPVYEIAERVKAARPDIVVHSDMVQSLAAERLQLSDSLIDLASFSAHKIHGPKGIGALYVRSGARWTPVMRGGEQENKRRGGTENVAGIVGFGAAAQLHHDDLDDRLLRIEKASKRFWSILRSVDGVHRNSPANAVPNILNVRIERVWNDVLLMRLDLAGVAASAGSACTAGALTPSHVLAACGWDDEAIRTSVRFSFSSATSAMASEAAARITRREIEDIRAASRSK